MTKKTLHITVRSDMGGGPKHLLDLVTELKRINPQSTHYIATPADPPFFEKFNSIANGIIVIPKQKFTLFILFKILIFCFKNKINNIHSHGFGAGIYSRFLSLFGFQIIHTFHGVHQENSLKIFLEKYLFRHLTDHFICFSIDEKNRCQKLKIIKTHKVSIIANGVSVQAQIPLPPLDLRKKLNLTEDKIILGTLCRLTYQKGIDLLIEILNTQKIPKQYVFIIAGDGEEKNNYIKKVNDCSLNDQIYFIGETQTPIQFLKGLDLFFSTSRGEGMPLSVLEAFFCGKACLLSNVYGHQNLGLDGQHFVLFETSNFREKLEECFKNKDKIENSIIGYAHSHYSLEQMAQSTAKLYM